MQERAFALAAMVRTDDDPVTLLEAASAVEHDQGTGAAIAIAGPTNGAFRTVNLQAFAFAADHPLALHLIRACVLLGLPGEPLAFVVGEGLATEHQRQLAGLVQRGELPPNPIILRLVAGSLGQHLGHFDGEDVPRILSGVWIGLHALDDEREIPLRKAEELANQAESLDGGLGALLQVQGEAHRGMLDVDVAIALSRLGQQSHQGFLTQVGQQRFRLALRRGTHVQAYRGDVRRPVGERRPRGNRRQP